jgi:hypothetical protein
MVDIKHVQGGLPDWWNEGQYPDRFNTEAMPHRHYSHALTHALKALGKLAALSDGLDHQLMGKHDNSDPELKKLLAEAPKLLADVVICTAKMAAELPEPVDLNTALVRRLRQLRNRWVKPEWAKPNAEPENPM